MLKLHGPHKLTGPWPRPLGPDRKQEGRWAGRRSPRRTGWSTESCPCFESAPISSNFPKRTSGMPCMRSINNPEWQLNTRAALVDTALPLLVFIEEDFQEHSEWLWLHKLRIWRGFSHPAHPPYSPLRIVCQGHPPPSPDTANGYKRLARWGNKFANRHSGSSRLWRFSERWIITHQQ